MCSVRALPVRLLTWSTGCRAVVLALAGLRPNPRRKATSTGYLWLAFDKPGALQVVFAGPVQKGRVNDAG